MESTQARENNAAQSGSELERCSLPSAAVHPPPPFREEPALAPSLGPPLLPLAGSPDEWSPPLVPGGIPCNPALSRYGTATSMPLHHPETQQSIFVDTVTSMMPIIMSAINIAVVMLYMLNTSLEATRSKIAYRKKAKRTEHGLGAGHAVTAYSTLESDEDLLPHPHKKQMHDIVAWHIQALDAKWYVKPRSTCWFDEYLFNIYTPNMFYDILRMRRVTFDRLVHDLRLFIQGQATHKRQPIAVEKKVVVALFKLMHGVSIPLVADKAALGKSTVYGILRQVCSAISQHFGHLIAWPVGRRLSRVTTAFQAKQSLPNCIGVIDGTHVYIAAPPNSIAAADHKNRYKSFFILLQAVVDSKCYFTSVNTGPPGSLHDSAHFKTTELYRKVEEGVMEGSTTIQ